MDLGGGCDKFTQKNFLLNSNFFPSGDRSELAAFKTHHRHFFSKLPIAIPFIPTDVLY